MAEYVVRVHGLGNPHLPDTVPFDFERFLFNEPFHLLSQPCSPAFIFHLFSTRNRIEARFNLFIWADQAMSPFRAPFGSVEFNARLENQYLDFFLDHVEEFVLSKGLKQLSLKGYPFCYAPEQAQILTQCLLRRGYRINHSALSYYLPVTVSPFELALHHSEKRRLKKCLLANFQFQEEILPDLAEVYAFVKASRLRRGYPLTLGWEDFNTLFTQFPEQYQVFTVKDGPNVVALTVTVRINDRILYNFYPADAANYQTFSPTVFLIKGLYDYCQLHGLGQLDLGIASDDLLPNYGLICFKKNLGAQASLKLSFEKKFSS
jgi:hypothetical protein